MAARPSEQDLQMKPCVLCVGMRSTYFFWNFLEKLSTEKTDSRNSLSLKLYGVNACVKIFVFDLTSGSFKAGTTNDDNEILCVSTGAFLQSCGFIITGRQTSPLRSMSLL